MSLDHDHLLNYLRSNTRLLDQEIDNDTPLLSSRLIDSFDLLQLISFVEQEAHIRVGVTEVTLDNFDSINRILDFAHSHPSNETNLAK